MVETIYNLGFFGGWREGNTGVDGHYEVITDGKEFCIKKIGDYGGLTWIKDCNEQAELTESGYRYVHDIVLKRVKVKTDDFKPSELPVGLKRYKLHNKRISANIFRGDTIKDLRTGEVFVVSYDNDLECLNRDFNYKLLDRELHPEPVLRSEFIKVLEQVNPFEKWEVTDTIKKGKDYLYMFTMKVKGIEYKCSVNYKHNAYYIETAGVTYSYYSPVSAPFYDTISLLKGNVYADYIEGKRIEYNVFSVETDKEFDHNELFTEEKSYRYNTALTYLQ